MAINDGDELISVPFKACVFLIGVLPSSALFLCVSLAMLLHWDDSTRTHCGVDNLFPSVSAAVASYAPEKYIWRFLIGLHATPRLFIALALRNFFLSSPLRPYTSPRWYTWACNIACFINLLENFFLLALTCISSVEDYGLHKASFTGFVITSVIYMVLSTWMFDYSGRRRTSVLGEKSFQYKVMCCTGEVTLLILAMYFFYRHNTYCEPYVYSMFALCEYAIIIFNILFHATVHYDFHSKRISLNSIVGNMYEPLPLHNYEEKRT
uniref:Post-GPI attachment to proteins factor 2 n=1 Tax=Panagrellus redivivus TaxID=6233 RepID=A0A7E4W2G2_PANRE